VCGRTELSERTSDGETQFFSQRFPHDTRAFQRVNILSFQKLHRYLKPCWNKNLRTCTYSIVSLRSSLARALSHAQRAMFSQKTPHFLASRRAPALPNFSPTNPSRFQLSTQPPRACCVDVTQAEVVSRHSRHTHTRNAPLARTHSQRCR
jgi:hypothetical protein